MKTIIFDMNGVILKDGWREGLKQRDAKYPGFPAEFEKYSIDYDTGMPADELYRKIGEALGLDDGQIEDLREMTKDGIRKGVEDRIDNKVVSYVQELKDRGYKVALLSNVGEGMAQILRERGAYNVFGDRVYLSCEIGYRKDNRKAYEIALKNLDTEPKDAFLVDDDPSNIEMARSVGMNGIVFKGLDQLKEGLESLFDD